MRVSRHTAQHRRTVGGPCDYGWIADDDLRLALHAAGVSVEDVERYLAAGAMVHRDETDRRASALKTCAREGR